MLKISFLGGVGEFGKNLTVYDQDGKILIVDAGSMFPENIPGIDLVIPDIQYLLEEPERLKAIVLTHAHEDHIGALPYILTQINVPIYASALTLAYVEEKPQRDA